MKIVFAGLVLIASAFTANATSVDTRAGLHHGYANAPDCPIGTIPKYLGLIDGKPTWICVPNP